MAAKGMISGPMGALSAERGAVSPFVADIIAIKGDNWKWG
jgi:hypothetical protein